MADSSASRCDHERAIEQVMYSFARGLDTCDWVQYRSVFTDLIELDYSSYRAGSYGTWLADDWVARAAGVFPGLDASQHAVTNLAIKIDGNEASMNCYVRADHVLEGHGIFSLIGRYKDRLVLTPIGWKISHKTLLTTGSHGDPEIMAMARQLTASGVTKPRIR